MLLDCSTFSPTGFGGLVGLAGAGRGPGAGSFIRLPQDDFDALAVGDLLRDRAGLDLLRLVRLVDWPDPEAGTAIPVWLARSLAQSVPCLPDVEMLSHRPAPALAWVTVSDSGYRGERADAAGPKVAETVAKSMELRHAEGFLVPDGERHLRALLTDLALRQGFELIVTTGGTGVAPRDLTPQATAKVLDSRLQGVEMAMTQASLAKTPNGMISRALAGTIGKSLVLNLPGSPKAVAENLSAVLAAIPHALDKLAGDTTPCAGS